jgi:para-aminobenzoate synthetase component I
LKRKTQSFSTGNPHLFIKKALNWAERENCYTYLCPATPDYPYSPFKHILAIGAIKALKFTPKHVFDELKNCFNQDDWLFGYMGYDLKNETEKLFSNNHDRLGFEDAHFYHPKHILIFSENEVNISSIDDPESIIQQINQSINTISQEHLNLTLSTNTSKKEYIQNVEQIKKHIIEGDIYELNYCIEFFAKNAVLHPVDTFFRLQQISPMPFSALHKNRQAYIICASPERFLKKEGNKLISQPIKGTRKRGIGLEEDQKLIEELGNDEKELAENMMIVDLVRNDLARSATFGTVKAEELFKIYTFKQVHQMISTVTSQLRPDVHPLDAIKYAFPMGSMTGAPKIKAMELIEQFENSKRGIFSGALGYFTPEGDFDFNVIIRSLLYDHKKNVLSFQAGSAITYDSIPEKEYEECLLKAKAIKDALLKRTS